MMSWSHFGGICLLQPLPTACVQCLSVCGWGLDMCARLSCVCLRVWTSPAWLAELPVCLTNVCTGSTCMCPAQTACCQKVCGVA